MVFKKLFVIFLKKLEIGSALSMRLVKLTRKHKYPIHPKHLIKSNVWYEKYLKQKDNVLDIGCGTGSDAIIVAKKVKELVGVDNDEKVLKIAKSLAKQKNIKNVKFIKCDLNKKLPFKNNSFYKIICSDVLEHLNKRNYALSEIKRVLNPKGTLFLVTDNPNTSWKRLQRSVGLSYYADEDHKHEYSKEEILSLLKKNKFKIISIKTVTYDTPLKGVIDLAGGISLSCYKYLRKWREKMNKKNPKDTTGYLIVAAKS